MRRIADLTEAPIRGRHPLPGGRLRCALKAASLSSLYAPYSTPGRGQRREPVMQ